MSLLQHLFNPMRQPAPKREVQTVGGGYYALQSNTSAGGIHYIKLVKADTSKPPMYSIKGTPSVGHRTDRPSTRRARRNVIKNN